MAEINRYTQMPAPLVINPISFEDFARVPLMKAKATGETIGATERINTDYNVDDADLGKISSLVEGIDKVKEGIVIDITNNGINSQSIGQVIALKRERDKVYKNKIQQAEENKKLLFAWRQKIDDMVMRGAISPEYGEKIKEKEYGKWTDKGGTFAKDNDSDLPRMFQENFGAKYFDIDKDFREQFMEAARQGDVKTTSWGSGQSKVQDVDGIQILSTPGGGSKTVVSNVKNLDAVMNRLLEEYNDPTTERGQFVNYADIDLRTLQARAEKYKREFLDTKNITQVDNTQRQVLGDGKKTDGGTHTNYDKLEYKPYKYQISDVLKNADNATSNRLTRNLKQAEDLTNKQKAEYKSKHPDATTAGSYWNGVKLANFFRKLIGNEVPFVDKMAVMNQYAETIQLLYERGDISQDFLSKAKNNFPGGYADDLIEKIRVYQEEKSNITQAPTIVTEDFTETSFGKIVTGIDPNKAAGDAFVGDQPMYDTKTRTSVKLNEDEKKEWRKKALEKKLNIKGNMPILSIDMLDEDGNYIPDLTSAYHVIAEDGTSYYRGLPSSLKDTPEYKRIDEINRKGLSLKPGEKTKGGFYLPDPKTGQYKEVSLRHSDSRHGEFQVIMDNTVYSLNENETMLNNLVGEEFITKK